MKAKINTFRQFFTTSLGFVPKTVEGADLLQFATKKGDDLVDQCEKDWTIKVETLRRQKAEVALMLKTAKRERRRHVAQAKRSRANYINWATAASQQLYRAKLDGMSEETYNNLRKTLDNNVRSMIMADYLANMPLLALHLLHKLHEATVGVTDPEKIKNLIIDTTEQVFTDENAILFSGEQAQRQYRQKITLNLAEIADQAMFAGEEMVRKVFKEGVPEFSAAHAGNVNRAVSASHQAAAAAKKK